MSFISEEENKISNQFLNDGYIVRSIKEFELVKKLTEIYFILNEKKPESESELNDFFNNSHKKIELSKLNETRGNL